MLLIILIMTYSFEAALYTGILIALGLWGVLSVFAWIVTVACLFLVTRLVLVFLMFFLSWVYRSPRPQEMKLLLVPALRLFFREYLELLRIYLLRQLIHYVLPLNDLKPRPEAGPYPVLLIHGFLCNSGFWYPAVRRLRARRVGRIFTINLEPPLASISRYTREVAAVVEEIKKLTGAPRVILVGHSMGGLVARAYAQRGGVENVARIITIGTPHHGTSLAWFATGDNVAQMRPHSTWLESLNAEPPAVPITCIYSVHDNLVAPQDSARLDSAKNIPVSGIGHLRLGSDPAVLRLVEEEIREAGAE